MVGHWYIEERCFALIIFLLFLISPPTSTSLPRCPSPTSSPPPRPTAPPIRAACRRRRRLRPPGMAPGSPAGRDSYDEEAAVRRPLELDGRDAASASSDHRSGELEILSYTGGTSELLRIWCGIAVRTVGIGDLNGS